MPKTFDRREFIKIAGGSLLAAAVTSWGWDKYLEVGAEAELPQSSPGAPNVLMIVLDTVRAQNLSLYGYHRPTMPNLGQIAKQGVFFEQAVAPAPWTLPSHASMFTGRFPHELTADWTTPLDATYPTLAEILYQHGYLTTGFIANTLYCSYESGLNRGFVHYEDYPVSLSQLIRSSALGREITNNLDLRRLVKYYNLLGRKSAERLNYDFLSWLSRQEQRPFFAFLNYFDAHNPYIPPPPYDGMFGNLPRRDPGVIPAEWWSETEIQAEIDAYDGLLAYLDHQLDLLLSELKSRGILDNTLLIITSDHGEEFGEHQLFGHGTSLYWPSLFVPLLISFPSRIPVGRTIRTPVTLRDLAATILDLLKIDANNKLPGSSLAKYWENSAGVENVKNNPILLSEVSQGVRTPKSWPISKGSMRSLVTDNFHYIVDGVGFEELYDIRSDPFEFENLAGSTEYRPAKEQFETYLEEVLR